MSFVVSWPCCCDVLSFFVRCASVKAIVRSFGGGDGKNAKIDAEAGGLDGGRAMVRLKLLENTGAEERGKAEVMLSKAQRAAKRYLKANNPFEAEKRLAEAQAEAEKEAAAEKRRIAKAKIASIGAIFEGN